MTNILQKYSTEKLLDRIYNDEIDLDKFVDNLFENRTVMEKIFWTNFNIF